MKLQRANMRMVLAIGSVLLVAGCSNTTEIQRRYVDFRDDCRGIAEHWVEKAQAQRAQGGVPQNLPPEARQFQQKDVNAQLATVFSDCMFEKGWTVATPPREKGPPEDDLIAMNAKKRAETARKAAEAQERAGSSRVLPSDGVGIGPSLEPGKNMPNFRKLKYQ